MKEILFILAHPHLSQSRLNRAMVDAAQCVPGVRIHDLYREYPDFKIDVRREQALLTQHDIVVFQFPFYWYSSPSLLKEWQDVVLEWGFAYGREGLALKGKRTFCSVTTGGPEFAYQAGARNNFTMTEFLRPFQQTFQVCHMIYEHPYLVQGSHQLSEHDLALKAEGLKLRLLAYSEESGNAASDTL